MYYCTTGTVCYLYCLKQRCSTLLPYGRDGWWPIPPWAGSSQWAGTAGPDSEVGESRGMTQPQFSCMEGVGVGPGLSPSPDPAAWYGGKTPGCTGLGNLAAREAVLMVTAPRCQISDLCGA